MMFFLLSCRIRASEPDTVLAVANVQQQVGFHNRVSFFGRFVSTLDVFKKLTLLDLLVQRFAPMYIFIFSHTSTFQLLDKPWPQVSSLLPPRFLPSVFIANRVQQSHCSSIFHRVLLTHALAFSARQFVRKKKSPRIYTSMHTGGFNSRN